MLEVMNGWTKYFTRHIAKLYYFKGYIFRHYTPHSLSEGFFFLGHPVLFHRLHPSSLHSWMYQSAPKLRRRYCCKVVVGEGGREGKERKKEKKKERKKEKRKKENIKYIRYPLSPGIGFTERSCSRTYRLDMLVMIQRNLALVTLNISNFGTITL